MKIQEMKEEAQAETLKKIQEMKEEAQAEIQEEIAKKIFNQLSSLDVNEHIEEKKGCTLNNEKNIG